MAQSFLDIPGLPLGLRNNNPGNLRPLSGGQKWTGEISPDLVHDFSRFQDVAYGLRAMITSITGNIVKDGKNTIRKLITSYAPASENNTLAYINAVANYTGMSPDQVIIPTRQTIEKIIRGQLNVELGANYAAKISPNDLTEAFERLSSNVAAWLQITIASGPVLPVGAIIGGIILYMILKDR
jgi:hypothetical protein